MTAYRGQWTRAQWLGAALALITLAVALIVISFLSDQRWLTWPALTSFITGIVVGNVGRWAPADLFRHGSHFEDLIDRTR